MSAPAQTRRRALASGGRSDASRPDAPSRTSGADGGLVTATVVLVGIGVLAMYSAAMPLAGGVTPPPHFVAHVIGVGLGVLLAFAASRIPLRLWRALALPLWLAAIGLLAATLAVGAEAKGAQRWLPIPGTGMRFQPVELAKFATVLAVAAILSLQRRKPTRSWRDWAIPCALIVLPACLLVRQPDLGNAVILVLTGGTLIFVAGAPLRLFVIPTAALAAAVAAFVTTQPYALQRIRAYLDPWGTDTGAGYQLVQSFVAFGRGGLLGVGIGDGRQKLGYLPEAHNDFILAVVAEELGLIGVLAVLGAFAALLLAGTRIALHARNLFVRLAAFGMTALLAIPAMVNVAVVTGVLPPKGLNLPLVSYGRSSLLVAFVAVGLLTRLCRYEAAPTRPSVGGANRRGSIA